MNGSLTFYFKDRLINAKSFGHSFENTVQTTLKFIPNEFIISGIITMTAQEINNNKTFRIPGIKVLRGVNPWPLLRCQVTSSTILEAPRPFSVSFPDG